jgi:hypothetical protein
VFSQLNAAGCDTPAHLAQAQPVRLP